MRILQPLRNRFILLLALILSAAIVGCTPHPKCHLLNGSDTEIVVTSREGKLVIPPGTRKVFHAIEPFTITWSGETLEYSNPAVPARYIYSGIKGHRIYFAVDNSRRLFLEKYENGVVNRIEPQPANFPIVPAKNALPK